MNDHLIDTPPVTSLLDPSPSAGHTNAELPEGLPPPAATNDPQPLHRKIAKLPKTLRDLINSMLDDARPAREIIAKLKASTAPPLPYSISEMNISGWRNSGYQRYLAQQERLALVQANREAAGDLIATGNLTTLPEATLQIVANQYYELLAGFSPETLREKLSEDPLKYTRFLNVFARLVREIVHLSKFRDASAKAVAIKLKQLDPDRELSDNEFDLLVNRMDRVFKVARSRKPGGAGTPASLVAPPEPAPSIVSHPCNQ